MSLYHIYAKDERDPKAEWGFIFTTTSATEAWLWQRAARRILQYRVRIKRAGVKLLNGATRASREV
ncbi:MAG: hypothetical protein WAM99_16710 [Xanthobacteraceae bacterium]|jgi:hypothetical protein